MAFRPASNYIIYNSLPFYGKQGKIIPLRQSMGRDNVYVYHVTGSSNVATTIRICLLLAGTGIGANIQVLGRCRN